MDTLTKMIGRTIRQLRKAKDWNQTDLAERAEVDQGGLSKLETGRQGVSIEALESITRALGLSVAEFMQLVDDASPAPTAPVRDLESVRLPAPRSTNAPRAASPTSRRSEHTRALSHPLTPAARPKKSRSSAAQGHCKPSPSQPSHATPRRPPCAAVVISEPTACRIVCHMRLTHMCCSHIVTPSTPHTAA